MGRPGRKAAREEVARQARELREGRPRQDQEPHQVSEPRPLRIPAVERHHDCDCLACRPWTY